MPRRNSKINRKVFKCMFRADSRPETYVGDTCRMNFEFCRGMFFHRVLRTPKSMNSGPLQGRRCHMGHMGTPSVTLGCKWAYLHRTTASRPLGFWHWPQALNEGRGNDFLWLAASASPPPPGAPPRRPQCVWALRQRGCACASPTHRNILNA